MKLTIRCGQWVWHSLQKRLICANQLTPININPRILRANRLQHWSRKFHIPFLCRHNTFCSIAAEETCVRKTEMATFLCLHSTLFPAFVSELCSFWVCIGSEFGILTIQYFLDCSTRRIERGLVSLKRNSFQFQAFLHLKGSIGWQCWDCHALYPCTVRLTFERTWGEMWKHQKTSETWAV